MTTRIKNRAAELANLIHGDKYLDPQVWSDIQDAAVGWIEEGPQTFKEYMSGLIDADWVDIDVACYYLAVSLGILEADIDYLDEKWLFWTNNKLSEPMYSLLFGMISAGVLEAHPEEGNNKIRWRNSFALNDLLTS